MRPVRRRLKVIIYIELFFWKVTYQILQHKTPFVKWGFVVVMSRELGAFVFRFFG